MNNKDKYFRTTNFNLASFLFAKDFELVNIDKTVDPKRAHFVFIDKPRREELAHEFSFASEDNEEVLVDARKLFQATRTLKEKLYQDS